MKCLCKHEVSSHIYNSQLDCYDGCEECGCEAFETPTFNEEDEVTELEF